MHDNKFTGKAYSSAEFKVKETIATFGKTRSLVGIVTHPENRSNEDLPAVIILNSGILHRVGPGRLYVKMARALAARGFRVLRFDLSGIGDSPNSDEEGSFEDRTADELDQAMNYLDAEFQAQSFILTGICSGAKIAYDAQCRDPRVVGAMPINIFRLLDTADKRLSSAVKNRADTRYLLQFSLLDPGSWLKLVNGRADYRGIFRKLGLLLRKLLPAAKTEYPVTQRIKTDIRSITARDAHLLLIYSVTDPGLDYVRETLGEEPNGWEDSGRFRVEVIRANHVFTLPRSQRELIALVENWLDSAFRSTHAESA